MLGIVFTEFVEMVEDTFGEEVADDILGNAKLATDGAYTAVGSYSHLEMLELVAKLSERTGISETDLLRTYGRHLAKQFSNRYSQFLEGIDDPFELFAKIDAHVHREVMKLYPNAKLPAFRVEHRNDYSIVLEYRSSRPFGELAHGLIQGTLDGFQCKATIEVEDLSTPEGSRVNFTITKAAADAA